MDATRQSFSHQLEDRPLASTIDVGKSFPSDSVRIPAKTFSPELQAKLEKLSPSALLSVLDELSRREFSDPLVSPTRRTDIKEGEQAGRAASLLKIYTEPQILQALDNTGLRLQDKTEMAEEQGIPSKASLKEIKASAWLAKQLPSFLSEIREGVREANESTVNIPHDGVFGTLSMENASYRFRNTGLTVGAMIPIFNILLAGTALALGDFRRSTFRPRDIDTDLLDPSLMKAVQEIRKLNLIPKITMNGLEARMKE